MALYSNNEPFLDERIPDFIRYAKKELPKAHHRIYTNGTLLTVEIFRQVMKNLDSMVIDNYSNNGELIPQVQEIYDYCVETQKYNHKLRIYRRKADEVLSSRGGQAPNSGQAETPAYPCFLPFFQMVVRPTGQVSLCCCDVYGKYTMGDLTSQTPEEVWNGVAFDDKRRQLRSNRQDAGMLCNACNMIR